MPWHIALALEGSTRPVKIAEAFVLANDVTGEIRDFPGGLNSLLDSLVDACDQLGRVAAALGPDVQRRWEAGDANLDLAAALTQALLRNQPVDDAKVAAQPELVPCPDGRAW